MTKHHSICKSISHKKEKADDPKNGIRKEEGKKEETSARIVQLRTVLGLDSSTPGHRGM